MVGSIQAGLSIVGSEWRGFIRTKLFLICGLVVPLILATAVCIVIVSNGKAIADGVDRWEYFQSELKRFGNDNRGTYAFEQSEQARC